MKWPELSSSIFVFWQLLTTDFATNRKPCTYFLKFLIISRKFHSHACILTARMPPITSFIISRRSSVTDAAFSRSWPAFLDSTEMYVITTKKKLAPTRACQPIRCQSRIPDEIISIGANRRNIILQPASLRRLASFETRLIVWPEMTSFRERRFNVRIWEEKQRSMWLEMSCNSYYPNSSLRQKELRHYLLSCILRSLECNKKETLLLYVES